MNKAIASNMVSKKLKKKKSLSLANFKNKKIHPVFLGGLRDGLTFGQSIHYEIGFSKQDIYNIPNHNICQCMGGRLVPKLCRCGRFASQRCLNKYHF